VAEPENSAAGRELNVWALLGVPLGILAAYAFYRAATDPPDAPAGIPSNSGWIRIWLFTVVPGAVLSFLGWVFAREDGARPGRWLAAVGIVLSGGQIAIILGGLVFALGEAIWGALA
jgi:hypothetical protein